MELSAKGNGYLYTPIRGGSSARRLSNSTLNRVINIVFWPAVLLAFFILGLTFLDSYTSGLVPSTETKAPTPILPAVSAAEDTSSEAGVSANSGTASNSNDVKANVTVNGQSIAVPENGSVNETITTESGSTQVTGQSSNSQSVSETETRTRSNLKIRVKSNSNDSNVRLNVSN